MQAQPGERVLRFCFFAIFCSEKTTAGRAQKRRWAPPNNAAVEPAGAAGHVLDKTGILSHCANASYSRENMDLRTKRVSAPELPAAGKIT
jgi:hypothetical protein